MENVRVQFFWFRRYAKICDLLVVGLFCDHGAAVAKKLLLFSSRVSQKKGVYEKHVKGVNYSELVRFIDSSRSKTTSQDPVQVASNVSVIVSLN